MLEVTEQRPMNNEYVNYETIPCDLNKNNLEINSKPTEQNSASFQNLHTGI